MRKTFLFILFSYCFAAPYAISQDNLNNEDSVKLTKELDVIQSYFDSNYDTAYLLVKKALNESRNTDYPIGRIKLLQIAAQIEYYYLNCFDTSIMHLNEMRSVSESIDYKKGIPWFELNLGNVYYYQDDFAKAMELYESAIDKAKKINDPYIISDALAGKSSILTTWSQWDSALVCLHEGLDYALRLKKLRSQFLFYDDIAYVYKELGNSDSSYYYYQKSHKVSELGNNKFGLLISDINIELARYLKGESDDPVGVFKQLQQRCNEEGFIRAYKDVCYILCDIYKNKKMFKDAYFLYVETKQLEESLVGTDRIRRVAELESKYYLRKKQIENEELTRQNEIKSLQLKNRRNILLFVLFALLQAVILLGVIYRKYRVIRANIKTIKEQERKIFEQEKEIIEQEKKTIEHKLQSQEREMTSKMMKIYHRNQLIEKVTVELNATKRLISAMENPKEINKKLQSLVNQLKLSSNEQMWEEFEASFKETNPGFLERLTAKYPTLTPNEIKLSIFLVLNLRTKDISTITQQNIKSINVARTRFRKKLGLDNTSVNLTSFLKSI